MFVISSTAPFKNNIAIKDLDDTLKFGFSFIEIKNEDEILIIWTRFFGEFGDRVL